MRPSFVATVIAASLLVACGGATAPLLEGDASDDARGSDGADAGLDAARSDGGDVRGDGGVGDAATNDGSTADAARDIPCGSQTCKSDAVCVVLTAGGGPCFIPPDGGACPDGKPYNGGCCDNTTTSYSCKPVPADCHGTLACPCAGSLCQCGGCQIVDAGVLGCVCQYP